MGAKISRKFYPGNLAAGEWGESVKIYPEVFICNRLFDSPGLSFARPPSLRQGGKRGRNFIFFLKPHLCAAERGQGVSRYGSRFNLQ